MNLHRHCVWRANTIAPVSSPDWNETQLGKDDTTSNRCGNFLSSFPTETNVAIGVANQNVRDEAIALTSRSHLLHWMDLHHLIFQSAGCEEAIHDLVLFDWQCVQIDVLNRLDFAFLHEAPKLGAWDPLLLITLALALTFLASFLAFAFAFAFVPESSLSEAAFTPHRYVLLLANVLAKT